MGEIRGVGSHLGCQEKEINPLLKKQRSNRKQKSAKSWTGAGSIDLEGGEGSSEFQRAQIEYHISMRLGSQTCLR